MAEKCKWFSRPKCFSGVMGPVTVMNHWKIASIADGMPQHGISTSSDRYRRLCALIIITWQRLSQNFDWQLLHHPE
jgi:hypothetical protein